jgi:hypothetical protein
MKIDKETKEELLEILYTIEDMEYDTELGKRVGKLLNKLENLLNRKDK